MVTQTEEKVRDIFNGLLQAFTHVCFLLLQVKSFFCPIEYVICLLPQTPENGQEQLYGLLLFILVKALIERNGALHKVI